MTIDFNGHRILTDKETIYLTKIQNIILKLLYNNKNNVVKREEIIKEIYNLPVDNELKSVIRKHISLLNKKIGKYITIKSIRDAGYILEVKINDNIKQVQQSQELQNNFTNEIDNSITSDFTFDSSQDILPF